MNNPLKYTDPSGEIFWLVAGLTGAFINTAIQGVLGNLNSTNDFLTALGTGFLGGVLAGAGATTINAAFNTGLASAISANLPGISISTGDFTLTLSPALLFGTHGWGIGANISGSVQVGDFSVGASAGVTSLKVATGTGKPGTEFRVGGHAGYDDGNFGMTLATNSFHSGKTSQRTGYASARVGDWSISYENDGTPFDWMGILANKGSDSYRTAAATVGYQDWRVGIRLYTGRREMGNSCADESGCCWTGPLGIKSWNQRWVSGPDINDYRMGALFVGYKGYELGWNHDDVRHVFQNKFAHTMISRQDWIPRMQAQGSQIFTSFRTHNPYTHW